MAKQTIKTSDTCKVLAKCIKCTQAYANCVMGLQQGPPCRIRYTNQAEGESCMHVLCNTTRTDANVVKLYTVFAK